MQSDQAYLFHSYILEHMALVDHSVLYPTQNKGLCPARFYSPVLEHESINIMLNS
jgi:hypothetical protein